jgi:hypothetical protein
MPAKLSSVANPVEVFCWPLDALRAWLLRLLAPLLRPFIAHRERRVALTGAAVVAVAFFCAALAPLWLLSLGPLLLGVPHVIGDARYLVVRPGLHRRLRLWIGVGGPLLWVTTGSWVGFLASAGAVLAARASWRRKLPALLLILSVSGGAFYLGRTADLLFVHLHNFVAVGVFLGWRRRAGRAHLWALAAFLGAVAVLFFGLARSWMLDLSALAPGLELWTLVGSYTAPGLDPVWGLRLLTVFAFVQSVHYSVWLRLIPEEARPQPTPRSFLQSYRALQGDFGRLGALGLLLLSLGIPLYGLFHLVEARSLYLDLARFHGYVELAALALFWTEQQRPHQACAESLQK